MKEEESFLRYHDENPGEIEPRTVIVERSGFSSVQSWRSEPCPNCGQERETYDHSQKLAIKPEGKGSFLIEEDVRKTAGITRILEPGTKIEVEIEAKPLISFGFVERVTRIKTLEE